MDPKATNPQNDDIDPLELEDQQQPDEEVAELAHIEEDPLHPDSGAKLADDERELVKEIDAIAVPEEPTAKKSGNQPISQALIERELTPEDWMDDGLL